MIHRFCVAPMMDRTDRHERFFLRSLTKKAYLYTEMINAQAILYGKTEELLMHDPSEHPIGIQLGGNDPAILTEAAIIAETYNYDEINLNIGCPSSKVQSGQFGAILMKNPELVSRCVEEIKKKVKVPVTVKCRIGVDNMDEQIGLSRFVNQVSKSGCSDAAFSSSANSKLPNLCCVKAIPRRKPTSPKRLITKAFFDAALASPVLK